jgi:hypothetical protein
LTRKAPYKFESAFLQRGVRNEPCGYQAAPCRRTTNPAIGSTQGTWKKPLGPGLRSPENIADDQGWDEEVG